MERKLECLAKKIFPIREEEEKKQLQCLAALLERKIWSYPKRTLLCREKAALWDREAREIGKLRIT
jgi:hypothetical protein